ncbi:hypothetical protein [Candidatus Sororendozoicomonas aggregata]|uniref:hypothetical protein n=1 Tax=Candidatus Sororendozoicomonas aggregata TaxID=3073239 RepID=UPI002ED6513D
MAGNFLEIVELASGEIVLRRSGDEDNKPLLTLSFSSEAKSFLQGNHLGIAKVMFDAGLNEVSRQGESSARAEDLAEDRVLH